MLPRGLAATAMRLPSGATSRPPIAADPDTSRPADAVRFTGSPPARYFTQTFCEPPAFDTYATHLPSGESTGPNSRAGLVVIGTIRENVGAPEVSVPRVADHHAHVVAASAASDTPAIDQGSRDRCAAISVAPAATRGTSRSDRASAMSRSRRF